MEKSNKIISAYDAAQLIQDGDTVAIAGFVGAGMPEEILTALENRFKETGTPTNLTVCNVGGVGNRKGGGLDRLAHEGLTKKVIGAYFNLNPKLQKMALSGEIEAYMFPLGVMSQLFREIAGGRPGVITHVGLNTFVDPRIEGIHLHEKYKNNDMLEVIQLGGRDWLWYKSFSVNVAIIRGTTADELGNMSMEKEISTYEVISMATAAKRFGGKVIVQVERVATKHSLHPKYVKLPGVLVDAIVVGKPDNHRQTVKNLYHPAYSGEIRSSQVEFTPAVFDQRKVIGRRSAMELKRGDYVNLGVGAPEFVAAVLGEENASDLIDFLIEVGTVGGTPGSGMDFGASFNADAHIDTPYMIDIFDGGILDISFLGFAQIDREGNVNVSKLGHRIPGVGGFINVTQNAKRVVFCGTLTAEGCTTKYQNFQAFVEKEGPTKKLVNHVQQITFSSKDARSKKQKVMYVTERCVFEMVPEGIQLIEIAPGIRLKEDILDQMEFEPLISPNLRGMDSKIFDPANGSLNLKAIL